VLRRLPGKARKRRHIQICQAFAAQPGRMHRRLKCEVIFARALRLYEFQKAFHGTIVVVNIAMCIIDKQAV
jgi:hypothetical protein